MHRGSAVLSSVAQIADLTIVAISPIIAIALNTLGFLRAA